MEYRNEDDLFVQIRRWKIELLKESIINNEIVLELESHLLDEITALKEMGLNDNEAFIIAKKRIGGIREISHEFNKVNRIGYFINNLIPYMKGVLIFLSSFLLFEILTSSLIIITEITKDSVDINFNLVSILLIVFLIIVVSFLNFRSKTIQWLLIKFDEIPLLILSLISLFIFRIGLSVFNSSFGNISMITIFQTYLAHYEKMIIIGSTIIVYSMILFILRKKNGLLRHKTL